MTYPNETCPHPSRAKSACGPTDRQDSFSTCTRRVLFPHDQASCRDRMPVVEIGGKLARWRRYMARLSVPLLPWALFGGTHSVPVSLCGRSHWLLDPVREGGGSAYALT